ncbi:MAG: hypothetical protein HYZ27_04570, partial [Deltaproteobacteria bacterium]|nr:hypothetical protein [Deltaproteobacteria bacterium]
MFRPFFNPPLGGVRSEMVRYTLVACLLTSVAGCGKGSSSTGAPPADDPPWQDIASTLEPLRAQYDLPAMTVAALAGDQLVALGAV